MNSEYIIIDHNTINPPEDISILKWWKNHKIIYLCIKDKRSLNGSEWDYVIKRHKLVDIVIIKKEDIVDILYEKAYQGIIIFTESDRMKKYVLYQCKNIESYFKICDPFKNTNICIGDVELFEYPIKSICHDICDFYWSIDNKSYEELHNEFCEKYID